MCSIHLRRRPFPEDRTARKMGRRLDRSRLMDDPPVSWRLRFSVAAAHLRLWSPRSILTCHGHFGFPWFGYKPIDVFVCPGPRIVAAGSSTSALVKMPTVRKDNAPQNLSLLKKIVLNLIRLDTTDKTKASLRLKRKGAAWDEDVRARILGLTPQWHPSAEALTSPPGMTTPRLSVN